MAIWEIYARQRITRRRILAGGGALAGAAALSACGGDGGDDRSTGRGAAGLLSEPEDTTGRARPGGVLKTFNSFELASFDVAAARSTQEVTQPRYTYPRLLKFKTARYPDLPISDVEGDLAETFEVSQDRLQMTLKLRSGLRWDARAPTSGREIDAQDVVMSWNRFSRLSTFRTAFAYSTSTPNAPIESISAPDSRTVVIKLHEPSSAILQLLAASNGILTMPKEADGGFDPKVEVRGYGPYLLERYEPSLIFAWRKNPDYYVKGRPLIDRIEAPIVLEYSTRLAQFRAGNIYTDISPRVEDILPTKKDVPDVVLRAGDSHTTGATGHVSFGYEGNSPFKDQRVRQAVSMLIDRESYVDLITNRDKFAAEGIPVEVRLPTAIPQGYDGMWLDPTDEKEFGANIKYLKFNQSEATKLLAAAGRATGFSTEFFTSIAHANTFPIASYTQILPGLLSGGGIELEQAPKDYNSDFLPNIYLAYAGGNTKGFNGIAIRQIAAATTAGQHMFEMFHPGGRAFIGATVDGQNAHRGDPEISGMIEKMLGEFDIKRQQALAHEFQRAMALKAYFVQMQVTSPGFNLTWPVVQNVGVYRAPPGGVPVAESQLHYWIDDTKPPLRKA